jgi:DNA-binding LytR/AlgR family response regulator
VIFQTAHDEHAIAAFEREAVDYLLKPVAADRLAAALDRARRRLQSRERVVAPMADLITRLEQAMPRQRPRRLLVRYQAGHRLVPVGDIVRFVAKDGLTHAVVAGRAYVVDDSLDSLEHRLSPEFVRSSRADLVAVDRVDRVITDGDGSATLTLTDGATVRVSRRRAAGVRKALER